ncbi:conserved hypothetical protein [Trichinella spiralis]|uniref:hypothetical protein n=1 Tax=Trichinella spiralis TaxID=6334 RepID=UPI0001EFC93E|nr:conserved hypothetical protein [Trichinella spiralis]
MRYKQTDLYYHAKTYTLNKNNIASTTVHGPLDACFYETDLPLHCDGNDKAIRFCTPIRGLNCQGLMNELHVPFVRHYFCPFFLVGLVLIASILATTALVLSSCECFAFEFNLFLFKALQIVKPAGGGSYQMDAYGPKVLGIHFTNMTNIRPEN